MPRESSPDEDVRIQRMGTDEKVMVWRDRVHAGRAFDEGRIDSGHNRLKPLPQSILRVEIERPIDRFRGDDIPMRVVGDFDSRTVVVLQRDFIKLLELV